MEPINVYRVALAAVDQRKRVLLTALYLALTACNTINSYALVCLINSASLTSNPTSNLTSTPVIIPIAILIITKVIQSLINYHISKIGARISELIHHGLITSCIAEFSECTMENQQKLSDGLFDSIYMVGQSIGSLTWIIPMVARNLLIAIGTAIYLAMSIGLPASLVLFIAIGILILYRFIAHDSVQLLEQSQDKAKKIELLRAKYRFEVSAVIDRLIHQETSDAISGVARTTCDIEQQWNAFHTLLNGHTYTIGTLATSISLLCLLLTPNITFMMYQLFDNIASVIEGVSDGYMQYMRNQSNMDEFNQLRSQYIRSMKVGQITLIPPVFVNSIVMRGFTYVGGPTLSWHGKPLEISLETPSLCYVDGLNGAGKTTFFNIIAGIIEDVSVDMSIEDTTISSWLQLINQRVIIAQNDKIITNGRTWREIIMCGINTSTHNEHLLHTIIEIVGLGHLFAASGNNLDTVLERPSGGERKRLLIARGLLRCCQGIPMMLIMDEPDAHVDRTFPSIIDGIRRIFNGPIFMTLHSADYLAQIKPDYVIGVAGGRVGIVA